MGYCDYLKNLLRPLGIYDLSDGSLSASELEALGHGLDGAETAINYTERESALPTAEGEGLDLWESLFANTPVHYSTELRREAIAALLRIGGDSFTLDAINDTISGCGIRAQVFETGVGSVQVRFPGVAGVPQGFEQLKIIIEDILPAHLAIEYWFWYLTWEELERKFSCWADIHALDLTWERLVTYVDDI